MKKGLNNNFLSLVFAFFLLCTNTIFFQRLQVNTISETINLTFGIDKILILVGFVIFTYIVIFNGTKRIVRFSELVVPFMSLTYLAVTFFLIFLNIGNFGSVIKVIFQDAFNLKSILAGSCCSCLLIGFKRSLFSHEAGLGTMPSISSMADGKYPINQCFVCTVGVYVDTLVMCTLTGFCILIFTPDLSKFVGVDLIIQLKYTLPVYQHKHLQYLQSLG